MLGCGTAVVLGSFALAWFSNTDHPALYDRLSQEDGPVEWSTVWAFLAASGLWIGVSVRERASSWGRVFPVSMALLCFFVAMEELSWGQRLLGVRAPSYFLEHNAQLESNLHNLASSSFRHVALCAVILSFGVVLPVGGRIPWLRPLLVRFGAKAPELALIPAFLACFLLYVSYPWRLTGEWVELGLGTSLFFFGLGAFGRVGGAWREFAIPLAAALGIAAAGWGAAVLSRSAAEASPELVEQVRRELDALKADHRAGQLRAECGTHTRVYRFTRRDAGANPSSPTGAFAALVEEGLPPERARFYLDPWQTPYWMLDECDERGSRRIAFYSFGPNRARDSDHWNLGGDDLGVTVFDWRAPPAE